VFLVYFNKEFIMRNWFRRLWQTPREPRTSRPPSFRPTLEGLEERSLLDAGMGGFMMGMNGGMTTPGQMPHSTMMQSSTMMMPSNGMSQLAGNAMMEARIDAFFHMLDSRLIAFEMVLVAQMPQLEGMVQSFNAMVTMKESALAGHPINDLSGMV
jgi:hypothetical protein